MIDFVDSILSRFKGAFSHTATFRWFVVVVCGFLTRIDFLGVTSFIRSFGIPGLKYDSLIKFFRSKAYVTKNLYRIWYSILKDQKNPYMINEKYTFVFDGTKYTKEGKHMPGVQKIFQESGDVSKPAHAFGSMAGGLSMLFSNGTQTSSIPLKINIQEGIRDAANWEGSSICAESHVVQGIMNAHEAACEIGNAYCIMDRYFLTVPAFTKLDELNSKNNCLEIITRAKNSCVAYTEPDVKKEPSPGRPRKKGESVKLINLFTEKATEFKEAELVLYGKKEKVKYLCTDLLWGQKLYKKLRFVLVTYENGNCCILVSTDTGLDPLLIIEAYGVRFKIEYMFKEFKHTVCGYGYHFWTQAIGKLNHFKKTEEPLEISKVTDPRKQKRILNCIEATDRFLFFASVAQGILQLISLDEKMSKEVVAGRFLRTKSATTISEASVKDYMVRNFYRLLLQNPKLKVTRLIQEAISLPEEEEEAEKTA